MPQTLWFFIAFVIVLALIGVAAWLVRRFGGNALGSSANRGRMPRLAVIDAAAVDGRRRLVLVRRDNVEHLLMMAGRPISWSSPISFAASLSATRCSARPPERNCRPRLAPDAGWSDADAPHVDPFEHREPSVPELPRAARGPYGDDTRRATPSLPDRHGGDSIPSFTPEPMVRPQPSRAEPVLRSDPPRAIPRSERTDPVPPRMPRPKRHRSQGASDGAAFAAPSAGTSRRSVVRGPEPRGHGATAGSRITPAGRRVSPRRRRITCAIDRPG